ncbi:hypothetical protein SLEP1_g46166 [Rubroshorea leprosula]|uniref:Reverse transcriptase zinc-binding domain-containing protein n=1 Tax=Rubroshorea leprosula TaxID=152421 RepID=A0AAV5LLI8_9ROSI|nr:hypothetical protein SLEP1_g46166 [Rubroshorea leprosula]
MVTERGDRRRHSNSKSATDFKDFVHRLPTYNKGLLKQCVSYHFYNFLEDWGAKQLFFFIRRAVKEGRLWDIFIPSKRDRRGNRYGFARFLDARGYQEMKKQLENIWIGNRRVIFNLVEDRREEQRKMTTKLSEKARWQSNKKRTIYEDHMKAVEGNRQDSKLTYAQCLMQHKDGGKSRETGKKEPTPSEARDSPWSLNRESNKIHGVGGFKYKKVIEQQERTSLLEIFFNEGFPSIKIVPMGGNLVLIDGDDPESIKELVDGNLEWVPYYFDWVKIWSPSDITEERFVWARIQGLPLHAWTEENLFIIEFVLKVKGNRFNIAVVEENWGNDPWWLKKVHNSIIESEVSSSESNTGDDFCELDCDCSNSPKEGKIQTPFKDVSGINYPDNLSGSKRVVEENRELDGTLSNQEHEKQKIRVESMKLVTGTKRGKRRKARVQPVNLGGELSQGSLSKGDIVYNNRRIKEGMIFEEAKKASVGRSEGVLCIWDDELFEKVSVVEKIGALAIFGLWGEKKQKCCIVNVYASCNRNERLETWVELLKMIKEGEGFWCIAGDFNSVRSMKERRRRSEHSRYREDLNDFIENAGLVDLPLTRRKFTWYKGDGSAMSRSILDHCPVVLKKINSDWGPKPFRALNCWDQHPDLRKVAKESWKSTEMRGWKGFVCKEKFKHLRNILKIWNHEVFGNFKKQIDMAEAKIKEVDSKNEITEISKEDILLRREGFSELWEAWRRREMAWKQKTKLDWVQQGDANSKLFHRIANNEQWDKPKLDGLQFKQLTEEDRVWLERAVSAEEVKQAVWECGDPNNIKAVKGILRWFELLSGLKINFNKSVLYSLNASDEWGRMAAVALNCKSCSLPFTYLGMPVGDIIIPKIVLHELVSLQRKFLWGYMEDKSKLAWLSWEKVCRNRSEGGLGVPNLDCRNIVMLGKWWDRFGKEEGSLWRKVVIDKYYEGGERNEEQRIKEILLRKLVLSSQPDQRSWSFDIANGYTVRKAYSLMASQNRILEPRICKKLWGKLIPSEISCFGWHLILKGLPTKAGLLTKGIQLQEEETFCCICRKELEDENHLFATCSKIQSLWMRCYNWWGISLPLSNTISLLCEAHNIGIKKLVNSEVWFLIFLVVTWSIWHTRNFIIHSSQQWDEDKTFDLIQRRTYAWIRGRSTNTVFPFFYWCNSPSTCVQEIPKR